MIRNRPIENSKGYVSLDGDIRTQASCLDRIYSEVSRTGLSPETVERLKEDIDYVAQCYGIGPQAVVLLAAILEQTNTNCSADSKDLARYLGCSNIEFIKYGGYLREMEKKGIIQMSRSGRRSIHVSPEAFKAVEKNGGFSPLKTEGLTPGEFFSRLSCFFKGFRHSEIDSDQLLENLDTLVLNNEHLDFCRKVLSSRLYADCSPMERKMFFYLCHCYVSQGEVSVPVNTLTNFTDYMDDDELIRRDFGKETMPLQKAGLVSLAIEDGLVNTDAVSLSDRVRGEFFHDVEVAPAEPVRHRDIVKGDCIAPKTLFFNQAEAAQMERLSNLLEESNFKEVQARLTATGMRRGFNVLFYGGPGTGKTASAYELARKTGRDVFAVDMSKLKSKWVGESEKSVKGVFRLYRSICRTSTKSPILLFNEADAIFSKRLVDIGQSTDQMCNAIQNIILQEMEDLDGILIATTNLLDNLDSAFERRFIFKVEFNLPEAEARADIWKSQVDGISEEDAALLARRYPFSGGNIENVSRKCAVEYVLTGKRPDLAMLETFCEEETLCRRERRTRIGF